MSDAVRIDNDGHVRTIFLNRPEKLNALSNEFAWGVVEAVRAAAVDDSAWVICITGTGRGFSAGLDLQGTGEANSPYSEQNTYMDDVGWVGQFFLTLRHECDKPIVAGVNGAAAGAGMAIAMAADIRIAAQSMRFVAGYPRIGGSPDGGLTATLTQAIGYEQAMRFLLENRTVGAEEALRLGMVSEVVPDDQLAARLKAYCAMLAQRSPIASRYTKRGLVKATTAGDPRDIVRYELANIRKAFETNDAIEARQAFLEKREPVFHGR